MGKPDDIVDIRCGMLFPLAFRIFGFVFVLTGLVMIGIEPLPSVALMVIGIGVSTAFEGTEIDVANRTFREYYSFVLFRKGNRRSYPGIDRLLIYSAELSQRVPMSNFWWSDNTVKVEFHAYVRFSDGLRVFLFADKSKAALCERLRRIAVRIDTSIEDHARPTSP